LLESGHVIRIFDKVKVDTKNINHIIDDLQMTEGDFTISSSGGTVYVVPQAIPIAEDHPTNPTSANGISKLMVEKYLALYLLTKGLDYVSPRRDWVTIQKQGIVAAFRLRNILKSHIRETQAKAWGYQNMYYETVSRGRWSG
jgi:nucleoside-diphosphate-sugar epimerase